MAPTWAVPGLFFYCGCIFFLLFCLNYTPMIHLTFIHILMYGIGYCFHRPVVSSNLFPNSFSPIHIPMRDYISEAKTFVVVMLSCYTNSVDVMRSNSLLFYISTTRFQTTAADFPVARLRSN